MYLMLSLRKRVEAALEAGFKKTQLARAANVSLSAVSQWLSGDTATLKGESVAGLAALTGWSVTWWAEGRGPRQPATVLAHSVSQNSLTLESQDGSTRVEWEAMGKDDLPDVFRVEVPDDAMADRVLKGHQVKFTKLVEPRPGDGVLVEDAAGSWYFRLYSPGSQGRFSAVAKNPAYQTLDSERDGLTVLAVLVGVPEARWG